MIKGILIILFQLFIEWLNLPALNKSVSIIFLIFISKFQRTPWTPTNGLWKKWYTRFSQYFSRSNRPKDPQSWIRKPTYVFHSNNWVKSSNFYINTNLLKIIQTLVGIWYMVYKNQSILTLKVSISEIYWPKCNEYLPSSRDYWVF